MINSPKGSAVNADAFVWRMGIKSHAEACPEPVEWDTQVAASYVTPLRHSATRRREVAEATAAEKEKRGKERMGRAGTHYASDDESNFCPRKTRCISTLLHIKDGEGF